MKIYLSALENKYLVDKYFDHYYYMLFSFFTLNQQFFDIVKNKCESILIDSGAHTFQRSNKNVDWDRYTHKYAEWIKANDRENIVGYFEMDVDRKIGYQKVLSLRKVLERVSDKIIPVWHKNRSIEDYKSMCRDYAGKWIAITGFKNEDIRDDQYMMFLNYAKSYGCKVHCLGMTRREILDKIPFDSVDSSSWLQRANYGKVYNQEGKNAGKKVSKEYSRTNRPEVQAESLRNAMRMQIEYRMKWLKYE